MLRRKRSFIRRLPLLLILAIGPVHAKTLFACAMMDSIVFDTCCCEDHAPYTGSDCDDAMASERGSCCEKSVELSIDHGSDRSAAIITPVEIRSDVDPPTMTLVATADDTLLGADAITIGRFAIDNIHQSGSRTYLITQRLRI